MRPLCLRGCFRATCAGSVCHAHSGRCAVVKLLVLERVFLQRIEGVRVRELRQMRKVE